MKNIIKFVSLALLLVGCSQKLVSLEKPSVPKENLTLDIDGTTYERPFPESIEEMKEYIRSITKMFEDAANLAIETSRDNVDQINDIMEKSKTVGEGIRNVREKLADLEQAVLSLRLLKAKTIAIGPYIEFGSVSPLSFHASFGPMVDINIFNSVLFSLGFGAHYNTSSGIAYSASFKMSYWIF